MKACPSAEKRLPPRWTRHQAGHKRIVEKRQGDDLRAFAVIVRQPIEQGLPAEHVEMNRDVVMPPPEIGERGRQEILRGPFKAARVKCKCVATVWNTVSCRRVAFFIAQSGQMRSGCRLSHGRSRLAGGA